MIRKHLLERFVFAATRESTARAAATAAANQRQQTIFKLDKLVVVVVVVIWFTLTNTFNNHCRFWIRGHDGRSAL